MNTLTATQFHKSIVAAVLKADKAASTMRETLNALIVSKYGKVAPTFEQYKADRAILKDLAKERGLADDQWLRKPYCAAVIATFGSLPVSMDAAAIAKRKARDAQGAKPGAKKGETTKGSRAPTHAETIEQFIARVGLYKVLAVCTKVLSDDASTKSQAAELAKLLPAKTA